MVSTGCGGKANKSRNSPRTGLALIRDDVLVGNCPKSVSSSANERSPPCFLCYRVGLAGHNFDPRAWLAGDLVAVQYRLQRAYA